MSRPRPAPAPPCQPRSPSPAPLAPAGRRTTGRTAICPGDRHPARRASAPVPGTTFFVGARTDGDVYVGDVRTAHASRRWSTDAAGRGRGRPALRRRHASCCGSPAAATGDVTAYDGRYAVQQLFQANDRRRPLPQRRRHHARRGLRHRLDGRARPSVVTARHRGRAAPPAGTGTSTSARVTGDYVQPAGFGLNGIRVLPGGDLVDRQRRRALRRRPRDRASPTGSRSGAGGRVSPAVTGSSCAASTLYVVHGFDGDELRRRAAPAATALGTHGALRPSELTDSDARPADDGRAGRRRRCYVVNGRFDDSPTTPSDRELRRRRLPDGAGADGRSPGRRSVAAAPSG